MGFVVSAEILLLLGLLVLIVCGGRRLQTGTLDVRTSKREKVRCIVPATGAGRDLATCIRSLLNQDYPDFEIIFVTKDAEDPASAVIHAEIDGFPHARIVHSGRTSTCAQKNHSILRGLREQPVDSEITVFCDCTRIAPPDWLRNLTAPIAAGEATVTSGYHHVLPLDGGLATMGWTCTVLLLYLAKTFPCLDQPWGGSTAIKTCEIERLEIPSLWARKVVDDVSLAAHLGRYRIRLALSPGAVLLTPVVGESISSWNQWLIRQWLYLKFCLPGSWIAAGFLCYTAGALLIVSGFGCVLGAAGWADPAFALISVCFLALVAGLGRLLMRHHPDQRPGRFWIAAFFSTLLLAAWSHLATLFMDFIDWKDIRYRVAWGGDVKEIHERRWG